MDPTEFIKNPVIGEILGFTAENIEFQTLSSFCQVIIAHMSEKIRIFAIQYALAQTKTNQCK